MNREKQRVPQKEITEAPVLTLVGTALIDPVENSVAHTEKWQGAFAELEFLKCLAESNSNSPWGNER